MASARSVRHYAYMVLKVLLVWFALSVPASLIVAQLLALAGRTTDPAPLRVAAQHRSAA